MKKSLVYLTLTLLIASTLPLSVNADANDDIPTNAAGTGVHDSLVAALTHVDLVTTLEGTGPFTVFAPTDEAFAALPAGTVETLLKPENKDQLTNILLYHVDDRMLSSDMIPAGSTYIKPILSSERLCVNASSAGVSIADGTGQMANVVAADIKTDNGVIHVIDKVLLPGTRPACH